MMKKLLHYFLILCIFAIVGGIGYGFYSFASNLDGDKTADTSMSDNTTNAVTKDSGDVSEDTTKPDLQGELVKVKMSGNIELGNGSWDFICKKPKVNDCAGSQLVVTTKDDSSFKKVHPIGEYVVITGEKNFQYKINNNDNHAKGLYFRKRASN